MSELERLFYKSRGTYRRLKVALLAARQRAQHAERERDELARIAETMRAMNQRHADDLLAAHRELLGAKAQLTEHDEQAGAALADAAHYQAEAERFRVHLADVHWPECAIFCDVQEERYGKPCDCPWASRDAEGNPEPRPYWAECHERLVSTERALDQLMEQTALRSPVTGYSSKLSDVMRARYGREAQQWKANHDQRKAERDTLRTAHDAMIANFDAACEELRAKSWPRVLARNLYTGAQLCRSYAAADTLGPRLWRPGCGRELP